MGLVHANIELINSVDLDEAARHKIGEDEVRRIEVSALVDSGAIMLRINEEIKDYLGLRIIGQKKSEMANGERMEVDIAGPVKVVFQNRWVNTDALVLPNASECLLGAIPLEGMDVLIDPTRQRLIVHPDHRDMAVMIVK